MKYDVFQALSDPSRRAILKMLNERSVMTVSQIWDNFNVDRSTITHHLHTLKRANLVDYERDGPYHYYSLNLQQVRDASKWFNDFF